MKTATDVDSLDTASSGWKQTTKLKGVFLVHSSTATQHSTDELERTKLATRVRALNARLEDLVKQSRHR
jgi:hypothetical protein